MSYVTTKFEGVRYRLHPTRKLRNGQPDKYFTIRYRVNGKRFEEPVGWASKGWTEGKVNEQLGELQKCIAAGTAFSLKEMRQTALDERAEAEAAEKAAQLGFMTFGAFLDDYYMPVAKREKRSWLTDEQRIAKEVKPLLGDVPLRNMTRDDVQMLADKLEKDGAAASTIKQYVGIVRKAYNIARGTVVNGAPLYAGQNPASQGGLSLPKIHNERERFFFGKEITDILKEARNLPDPDLHDAIALSLNAGLRLGELARLDWLDVNLVNNVLTVREESKRKPGGKVPMNAECVRTFKRRRETAVSGGRVGPVFPYSGGPLAWQQYISKGFKGIVDKLKLNEGIDPKDRRRRVVFHTLRHTFGSWLAIGGTDIYRIQKLMRHRNIAMTMRYAHLYVDHTVEAVHNLKPPKES